MCVPVIYQSITQVQHFVNTKVVVKPNYFYMLPEAEMQEMKERITTLVTLTENDLLDKVAKK